MKRKNQSSRFGEKAGELAGGEYNPKKKERKEEGSCREWYFCRVISK
jgi:hypothetical protein